MRTNPKLSAFSLNLFAITFNSDLWVTQSRHALATLRRANTIVLILLALIVGTLVLVIHDHWCCYPVDAGIEQYTLGWCISPNATIFTDDAYASYRIENSANTCGVHTYQTWEWIFIGLLSASCALFVGSYLMTTYYFAKDLYTDTIWQLPDIVRLARHQMPGNTANLESYLDEVKRDYHALTRDERSRARRELGSSPVTALRVPLLWLDPFAFVFDLPGFVWKPRWASILTRWTCHALIALLTLIFIFHTKPAWEKRCCYPASGRFASARLGVCTDSRSPIRTSSIDRTCDSKTWNWEIWFELMLGLLLLLVSLLIYAHSFFEEYHLATLDTREYIELLHAWVDKKSTKPSIVDFISFNRKVLNDNTPPSADA